jgi:hypothetical protein
MSSLRVEEIDITGGADAAAPAAAVSMRHTLASRKLRT